ncbi:MAG: SDR family oxidoreductase, partial [Candidatus Hodarchaeales archaeon]
MKVLVTGASGFIGKAFVKALINENNTFFQAVKGKDVIVHFAANFDFLASEESLFKQNVDATRELAEVAL